MSGFNAKEVQGRLEEILAGSHRQVAARCALYCSELVEAAREDERRAARERQRELDAATLSSPMAPRSFDGGAWTRGFFGDSIARSSDVARIFVQQPTLDSCHAERTNDRDCVWILRTAFSIRNKVIQDRRVKASDSLTLADPVRKDIEEDTPSTSSFKHAKTILDPKLVERIIFFRDMVQRAVGLWQETLLDDTPCLSRRATTDCQVLLNKAVPAESEFGDRRASEPPIQRFATEGGHGHEAPLSPRQVESKKSPYRHLISTNSPGESAKERSAPDRMDSPISATTPKSRKEVQEDLGRELAQLAEDLRNAQIISSH